MWYPCRFPRITSRSPLKGVLLSPSQNCGCLEELVGVLALKGFYRVVLLAPWPNPEPRGRLTALPQTNPALLTCLAKRKPVPAGTALGVAGAHKLFLPQAQ